MAAMAPDNAGYLIETVLSGEAGGMGPSFRWDDDIFGIR